MTSAGFLKHVDGWLAAGKRVAGPVRTAKGSTLYSWIDSAAQLDLAGAARPANSIKQFFFPAHERLFAYRISGKQVTLEPAPVAEGERIVIAARPCDAAALARLDALFNWDSADESFNRRRGLTTVVTLACTSHDEYCFCTSVGSGPGDTAGSDAMLYADADTYHVVFVTEKGAVAFAGETAEPAPELPPGPRVKFDAGQIAKFLAGGFEDPFWRTETLGCVGCGACAYSCPACHCFDMVDEGAPGGGHRVRNWDSCQFPTFTAHASGHNPRGDQGARQRQRIYHKFDIYPRKFGPVLCTGCGNCERNCPAGLGVLPLLEAIAR
jgi:ferredoxin